MLGRPSTTSARSVSPSHHSANPTSPMSSQRCATLSSVSLIPPVSPVPPVSLVPQSSMHYIGIDLGVAANFTQNNQKKIAGCDIQASHPAIAELRKVRHGDFAPCDFLMSHLATSRYRTLPLRGIAPCNSKSPTLVSKMRQIVTDAPYWENGCAQGLLVLYCAFLLRGIASGVERLPRIGVLYGAAGAW